MAQSTAKPPPYEDILGCQTAFFELAESFDTKDWDRLAQCLAPTLYIDYRGVIGKLWEAIPAAEFITLAASAKFLGDRRLQTQHFIGGAAKWVRTGDDAITGYHQMRVAHQRYKDDERKEVLCKGHCHGKATVRYRKVEEGGVWKLAGMEPDIRWTEGEFDKVFPH